MYDHIADAIKRPDIIKLHSGLYLARFESMKVYSALHAVKTLIKRGEVDKNTVLVDSSSGIYAYALALACHKFGVKCHIVASKTVDASTRVQLELLGAYVDGVPSAGTLKLDQSYRVEKVKELIGRNQNYHWMQQYHDDIHYGGYEEFADAVIEDIGSSSLTIVGGVGSGCSTGALGLFLRKKGVEVNLRGIQPFGSVTFGAENIDDPDMVIAGIGSAIDFLNVKYDSYNSIDWLSFDCCLTGAIDLMKRHAIFAGLSSGGSYFVGEREARLNPGSICMVIAPDTGHRYVESVFLKHEFAKFFDRERPKIIRHASELALPWSRFQWDRNEKSYLSEFSN